MIWTLILRLALAGIAFGATPTPSIDWNAEWQKVCGYDNFCQLNRVGGKDDGAFVPMSKVGVEGVRYRLDTIRAAAAKYDIPPEAVIGAIMADQSLTPMVAEGRSGLGIVYERAVVDLEAWAAEKEKREKRITRTELMSALEDPTANIYYVAAILADAREKYRTIAGVDIGTHPELLTTLYNLGLVENKALNLKDRRDQAQASGQSLPMPRENFFGFFVRQNATEISALAKEPQKAPPTLDEVLQGDCGSEILKATLIFSAAMDVKKGLERSVEIWLKQAKKEKPEATSACREVNVTQDGHWLVKQCISWKQDGTEIRIEERTYVFESGASHPRIANLRSDSPANAIASLAPRNCRASIGRLDQKAIYDLAKKPTQREIKSFKKEVVPTVAKPPGDDPFADLPN